MTRQIVLDTETTGLDPLKGDRVIEIAAIELANLMPTGRTFHTLLDPERDVPEESTRVHGFTAEMLRGKAKFPEVAEEFLRLPRRRAHRRAQRAVRLRLPRRRVRCAPSGNRWTGRG